MQPLYTLYAQPTPISALGPTYAPHLTQYNELIGNSALGHLFLRNADTGDYAVYHTLQASWKNYGPFGTTDEFRERVLEDGGFRAFVLDPDRVAAVEQRIGPLEAGEVYFPVPYPFLGGSGAPETYNKGGLVAFVELVGRLQLPKPDADG